jgi:hypothetical protein
MDKQDYLDSKRDRRGAPRSKAHTEIHSEAYRSDTWKCLRNRPNIKNIKDLLLVYNAILELSDCDGIGATDTRLMLDNSPFSPHNHGGCSGANPNDHLRSYMATLSRDTRQAKSLGRFSSSYDYEIVVMDQESFERGHDPYEKKELVDYWLTTIERAIEAGISKFSEKDQGIWRTCRLGVTSNREFLRKKEEVAFMHSVTERWIRLILEKIDKRILNAFEAIVDADEIIYNLEV